MAGGALLLLLGLGAYGAAKFLHGSSPVVTLPPPSSAEVVAGIEKQQGAWGDLEISDIQIDPPDEYAAKLYVPTTDGVWFFGSGFDRSRVLTLFSSADLTQSQQAELADAARWQISTQGIRITPDPATVFKLSGGARSRIYRALSEFPENYFQASPFMFSKKRANDWFFHSGLAAETVALISGLLYEHGGMLCFSDVGILSHISSDAEKTRLIMALSRTPTVLVNLRVPPGADPAPLIRYWCRTGDGNGARQLINSVARERNGGLIDITHLLPAFVRDHIYTYPRASADQGTRGPDCFWSALSFDREVPDYNIVNETYLIERLKVDYEATRETPQLGDIFTFSNAAGRVVHACVYIAGNVVFTKNGNTAFAPWVFMRIQDAVGIYSTDMAPKIICFRKKALKGS